VELPRSSVSLRRHVRGSDAREDNQADEAAAGGDAAERGSAQATSWGGLLMLRRLLGVRQRPQKVTGPLVAVDAILVYMGEEARSLWFASTDEEKRSKHDPTPPWTS
jgi:hypothetical protein